MMRGLLLVLANTDRFLTVLIVGLLALALGCTIFMRETAGIPADKSVITLVRGGYKRDREEWRELKSAFEARQPDKFVNIIQTNLERKADTMIAAGVPPDVVFVGVDRYEYYVESEALLDLMPLIEADADLRRLLLGDAEHEPDFYPQMLKPFIREHDGRKQLFVLPIDYTPFIIFYNKDLFDRYRVPYPDEDWDWAGLRSRALALTRDAAGRRPDQPGFDRGSIVTYGFQYASWQHGVETFIRQNGGKLVSDDGLRVVAEDPRTVEALQFLFDLKYTDHVTPAATAATRNIGFGKGTVGIYLYGVFAIPSLRSDAPNLDWDIAPLPRGPTGQRASLVFTNGYGIARGSKNQQAAFEFLKFLASDEALAIKARFQVFLPCRKSVLARTVAADPTERPRSTWVLTHDLRNGYAQPPFSTRQYYSDVYECVNEHLDELLNAVSRPGQAGETSETVVRRSCESLSAEGNRILDRDQFVRRQTGFGVGALALAAAPAVYLLARLLLRRRAALSPLARAEERWGYALVAPWAIGFIVFAAAPILISIAMSLARWQSLGDFTRAEFVGFENYRTAISGEDPKFYPALWVTLRYALVAVPAGLLAGLALALLMNQRMPGIAAFRTLYYVPAILPSVATAVLWWYLFDANHGWINRIVALLNFDFGGAAPGGWIRALVRGADLHYPINWLTDEHFVPLVFILMSLWGVGGGMIIYLSGLQSIPTQLYEAAELDGAGRWGRLRHVTLPMLSPVIFFNLVMGIIGSFQVFNMAFVLYDGSTGPRDSALFYGLHLFREAFFKYRLGYASALAWILFIIILALTMLVFKSSPMWVHYEAARRRRA